MIYQPDFSIWPFLSFSIIRLKLFAGSCRLAWRIKSVFIHQIFAFNNFFSITEIIMPGFRDTIIKHHFPTTFLPPLTTIFLTSLFSPSPENKFQEPPPPLYNSQLWTALLGLSPFPKLVMKLVWSYFPWKSWIELVFALMFLIGYRKQ